MDLQLLRPNGPGQGEFAVTTSAGKVFFMPYIQKEGDQLDVYDILISPQILKCTDSERLAVSGLYDRWASTALAYYELCIYDCPSYPYRRSQLEGLLSFDLSKSERAIVNQQIAQLTLIYLIRDGVTGQTKIGQSHDPGQRLKQLIKQDTLLPQPNDFSILFCWEDYPHTEQALHRKFSEKRARGEWFNLDDEDVAYIQQIYTNG